MVSRQTEPCLHSSREVYVSMGATVATTIEAVDIPGC